jgi:acetyltransferase-like isoleucine patch superfamily enzyme
VNVTWLAPAELEGMGFLAIGENVLISDKSSIYNCANIAIGNNVRIDDFCVLSAGSGGIRIGDHVHIAVYASLIGAGAITVSDFCNLSSRVSIYSSNDDYSGLALTNPTVPSAYTNVMHQAVTLGRHVIIGCNSVVLPGVTMEDGVAIGALSLVQTNCKAFGIYAGCPAKRIKDRARDLLEVEKKFRLGSHH